MTTDFRAVGKGFTDYYYSLFDSNRQQLRALYREHSMLSFEGTDIVGVNSIMEKIEGLPFQKIVHNILSVDAQPSHPQLGSIMVTVTGQLVTDDEAKPLFFCQTFNLMPENSSYWVFNDIFRLNYG
ncbi:Nuclear transport factor 2 [Sorochytrium milnesiophthora]